MQLSFDFRGDVAYAVYETRDVYCEKYPVDELLLAGQSLWLMLSGKLKQEMYVTRNVTKESPFSRLLRQAGHHCRGILTRPYTGEEN